MNTIVEPASKLEENDAVLAGNASPTLERMVKVYVKIRDARAERKRAWEAEDAKLDADMAEIRKALLSHMEATGAQSVGTEYGTVYRSEEIKCSCDDWGVLYEFIKNNDAFDLMEKRIARTRVKEYMDNNEGRLPPGVSVFKEVDVKIRRK